MQGRKPRSTKIEEIFGSSPYSTGTVLERQTICGLRRGREGADGVLFDRILYMLLLVAEHKRESSRSQILREREGEENDLFIYHQVSKRRPIDNRSTSSHPIQVESRPLTQH